MYSDKVKLNEKPNRMRLRHGDVIIRSEYNDGVLRNNNRANNRLSNQMEMFDKAQRVIMKDLGKETQFIRNKMNATSPRLQRHSPVKYNVGQFNINSKSTFAIKVNDNESPRQKKNYSTFQSLSDRSMYSLEKKSVRKNEQTVGRVRPVFDKTDNKLQGEVKSDSPNRRLHSSVTPRGDRKTDTLNSFTPRFERKTDTSMSESNRVKSQMSATTASRIGGIRSSVVENGRQQSATSRLSFIEILQQAEEAKLKGLTIEEHVPRPKTPELLSDYGSDESPPERTSRRKQSHIGATPKSTFISHHM